MAASVAGFERRTWRNGPAMPCGTGIGSGHQAPRELSWCGCRTSCQCGFLPANSHRGINCVHVMHTHMDNTVCIFFFGLIFSYLICIYRYMWRVCACMYVCMHVCIGIVSLRASVSSPFRSSWTRTLLGACETCTTPMKCAQLLWNVHNCYGTCATPMKRAQLLWLI